MTGPQDASKMVQPHDPGVPEDFAGAACDDGWDVDPVVGAVQQVTPGDTVEGGRDDG